jgi:hypothetical protein
LQALWEHIEWMMLPAMCLLRALNALSQPEVLQSHSPALQSLLELSSLERAAAIGQQAFLGAKSRADELEPGRTDPTTMHSTRGWFKQCKELVCPCPLASGCMMHGFKGLVENYRKAIAALEVRGWTNVLGPLLSGDWKRPLGSAPWQCSPIFQDWIDVILGIGILGHAIGSDTPTKEYRSPGK